MDTARFLVFVVVSFVVFLLLLKWVLRARVVQPPLGSLLWVATLVVGAG